MCLEHVLSVYAPRLAQHLDEICTDCTGALRKTITGYDDGDYRSGVPWFHAIINMVFVHFEIHFVVLDIRCSHDSLCTCSLHTPSSMLNGLNLLITNASLSLIL